MAENLTPLFILDALKYEMQDSEEITDNLSCEKNCNIENGVLEK